METAGTQVDAWLESARRHTQEHLREGEGPPPPNLNDDVIRCVSRLLPLRHEGPRVTEFPLSYSFISLSHLLSLQHAPCVSLLGWGTERFKRWSLGGALPAEVPPSAPEPLPRARLLLLGYITDQPPGGDREHDGNLYIRDRSGCIPCEMSHLDLSLLGRLALFPCWAYVPCQPGGGDSGGGGYVEVLSPPVPVLPPSEVGDPPNPVTVTALSPGDALLLLNDRSGSRRSRVTVCAELSRVTSILRIRHKIFFFFFLEDSNSCVPIIVQVPSKLSWYHALCVGDTYSVTSLSVSSLRGSPRRVFAVTSSSCLLPRPPPSLPIPAPAAPAGDGAEVVPRERREEERPPQERGRGDRRREAKTLTYQGVLTRVLDARAGLYELDGKVTLCTAYLQLLNGGRGLREGARVEVSDAHLQQSPCPLFPPLVLSCCLRSRVRVSRFSRLCSPHLPVSAAGNGHIHLLFRYRLRLPEYLWVSRIAERLQEKLCPRLLSPRCLAGTPGSDPSSLAERLISNTLSSLSVPGGRCERDPQGEILRDPHDCPLREYSPLYPPWSLPPLSLLSSLVCDAQYLRSEERNLRLRWSHHSLRPEDLPTPPRLLGVFHSSPSGYLQLQDQTFSLPCLVLPRPPTAWIGCVLEVSRYQLITERIQETDEAGGCKSEGNSKTYALFHAHAARILHPADSLPSRHRPAPGAPPLCKQPRVGVPWASRLLLLGGVEGRSLRPGPEGGLQFQARATWVGEPRLWEGEEERGGERRGEGREQEKGGEEDTDLKKVLLLFSNSSVRWFHFLQPNKHYRLIATGETDLAVFDCLGECPLQTSYGPLSLRIPQGWMLQDVETLDHLSYPQEEILSVEEALKGNSPGSLLSVTGVVSHRSLCDTQSTRMTPSCTRFPGAFLPRGVTLKVTLAKSVGHPGISVYVDLSRGPYPLGLLRGAAVLLQGLERRVSRSGSVYLRSVPISCVTVLSSPTESSEQVPAPPLVLFTQLPGPLTLRRSVCSVSCVLSVTLRWVCSACGDVFREGTCERSPSCCSPSGVFRATARVKADDGCGEVMVQFQGDDVALMLGVSCNLWEAIQRRVLSRGEVRVQHRGRNCEVSSEVNSEDTLWQLLTSLISRPAVSRPLILTFTQRSESAGAPHTAPPQLRRFTRGERDYMTRLPPAPTLTCVHLQEAEPRALCHMIRDRGQSQDGA